MKKLLLLFALAAVMPACTPKTQSATVEDSIVIIENVVDTTAVDSIVSNNSIQLLWISSQLESVNS